MENDDVKRLFLQLDKMDNKLDILDGRLDKVDVTQAKQEIHLEEHIRRTELAEHNIELLRLKQEKDINSVKNQLLPLQKARTMGIGILKFLGAVGVLGTVVSSIFKVVPIFKSWF